MIVYCLIGSPQDAPSASELISVHATLEAAEREQAWLRQTSTTAVPPQSRLYVKGYDDAGIVEYEVRG